MERELLRTEELDESRVTWSMAIKPFTVVMEYAKCALSYECTDLLSLVTGDMGEVSTPTSLKGAGEGKVVDTKGVGMSWTVTDVAGFEEPEL